ncbi:MAG: Tat pathway signal protein [Pseudomonadota bacterium]
MLNRRSFIASAAAASTLRLTVPLAAQRGRWVLKLVADKARGGMRAVERWVPY